MLCVCSCLLLCLLVVYCMCFSLLFYVCWFFPNSVSLEGSNSGKKELSPFSESTGGDRRIHWSGITIPFRLRSDLDAIWVPIWVLPAPGSFSRRAVFPDPGPWICDTGHIFNTFWTNHRDSGSWILRQLHTFDTLSDPGLGPLGAGFDDSYTLSTHSRNWIGSDRIGFAIQATFFTQFGSTFRTLAWDPGRWIWWQLHTFHTLGCGFLTFTPVFTHLDRIGSDRSGSNIKESLCVDPIVKNPYVWIQ